jgi:dGTPase
MPDGLQSYAVTEAVSKGRAFPEPPHPYRSDFERDRDRIIHSSAFRRLEGKTQVFSPGLDDYYRSRLTHSIEVAQIGRTIAKVLGLNESLTEAICLAHDLGHPPFGHSGEEALNDLMAGYGGFEHNAQTLRIVTLLEHPYPAFMGLNLMYETRLGLARKCVQAAERRTGRASISDFGFRIADSMGGSVKAEGLGDGFTEPAEHHRQAALDDATPAIINPQFGAEVNCTLEGQVADVADRIAYNCHDLEDGLRARLTEGNQMHDVQIYVEAARKVGVERIPDWTIRRTRTAKTITDRLVSDCIDNSRRQIAESGIRTAYEACARAEDLVSLSSQSDRLLADLERFLHTNFYGHERLREAAQRAKGWLAELFGQLRRDPHRMPSYFRDFIPEHGLHRVVCDYIAGMTDRYCLKLLSVT